MDTLKAILPLVMFCFVVALVIAVVRCFLVIFRGVHRECSTCPERTVCDYESSEECYG